MTTINPLTGREITIGSKLYNKLVKQGIISESEPTSLRDVPKEVQLAEIFINLPFDSLISHCSTSKEYAKICNDPHFLIKWVDYHEEETSRLMLWLARSGKEDTFIKLMDKVEWDPKEKKLALLYWLEQLDWSDHGDINEQILNYLKKYTISTVESDQNDFILEKYITIDNFISLYQNLTDMAQLDWRSQLNLRMLPSLYVGNYIIDKLGIETIKSFYATNEYMDYILMALADKNDVKSIREIYNLINPYPKSDDGWRYQMSIVSHISLRGYKELQDILSNPYEHFHGYTMSYLIHDWDLFYYMFKIKKRSHHDISNIPYNAFWKFLYPVALSPKEYLDWAMDVSDLFPDDELYTTIGDMVSEGEVKWARELAKEVVKVDREFAGGTSGVNNLGNILTVWDE